MNVDKGQYLTQLLDMLHIDPLGTPADVLPVLKNIVNNVKTDKYYFFLWNGEGETVAHGRYPQLIGKGPAIYPDVAEQAAALVPNISAADLQGAALALVSETISAVRKITYPWSDGTRKTAYVIRLLIGDQVYILGI